MKTIRIHNHYVDIYDGIKEMPIMNFHLYNKYVMIESGVGGDAGSVGSKLALIGRYIVADRKDDALKELQNAQVAISLAMNCSDPALLSFCSLVKAVDGKDVGEMNDNLAEQLRDKIKRWGVERSWLVEMVLGIKKKTMRS